ncbi:MAG: hypothetical protein JRE72_04110 [Deltaproteobacteria bacterium]|jgi:hypothetical protein|nr:hypothetical protein [Deltaproteobacteria bacterium]
MMRLIWTGLVVLMVVMTVSCATESGPRFNSLRAADQQRIQQQLENNWTQYIIYYIPQHAVLFDPVDDANTLKVSSQWTRVADQKTWVEILRQNTQSTDNFFSVWLGARSGFLEIIGPDEQRFGYLVHEKMDLVAFKIIDRHTMQIFYSPQRIEGP